MADHRLARSTNSATPKANCRGCGTEFEQAAGQGRSRLHCTVECRIAYKVSRRLPMDKWARCRKCGACARSQLASLCNRCYSSDRKRKSGLCIVHKCRSPTTSSDDEMCPRHGGRGKAVNVARGTLGRYVRKDGYVELVRPDHPLAKRHGRVFEHRVILFEKSGGISLPCFWCAKDLDWDTTVADHLNEIKGDNDPDNLVPSCNDCNRARGAMIPFISRMRCDAVDVLVTTIREMNKLANGATDASR
jgi:hypothetical protein